MSSPDEYEQFWSIWFGLGGVATVMLLLIMVRIAKAIEKLDVWLHRMDQRAEGAQKVRPWPPKETK